MGIFKASGLAVSVLIACLGLSSGVSAMQVMGVAHVVDGDTLSVDGTTIRLHGIDAPESAQTCEDAAGHSWPCGHVATGHLRQLAQGRTVTCEGSGLDAYRRLIARCRQDGKDLEAAMVSEGLAWAFRRYSEDHVAREEEAHAAGRGVWQGLAEPPWLFRSGSWTQAKAVIGQDCPIKGNISRQGERIYHMPWQRDYARTIIDANAGERWFCNENEATSTGWRKASR